MKRLESLTPWLYSLPLVAFIVAFLVLPSLSVVVGAFRDSGGHLTLAFIQEAMQPQYQRAFVTSISLSLTTAILGGLIGFLLAYALMREGSPQWLRSLVTSFSGVAANFAGVPLAFAFIATLGTTGLMTRWLKMVGLDLYGLGFSLFSFTGLVVVYLYFQIPLMLLIIAPALEGLRREWLEATENLGGNQTHFWRWVGLPILLPALTSAVLLLFGNAFSAYATPYALTSGALPLVPLQIGAVLQGNVLSDPGLGRALALGMIVVMGISLLGYLALERWGAKWRRP